MKIHVPEVEPHMCRWIDGDPKTDDWSFCEEPKKPGCSYCAEHQAAAYRPVERKGKILPSGYRYAKR